MHKTPWGSPARRLGLLTLSAWTALLLTLSACDVAVTTGQDDSQRPSAGSGRRAHADRGERRHLSDAQALALYAPAHQKPGLAACPEHFPAGRPLDLAQVAPDWRPTGLCSENFAVVHSGLAKTPLLVIERLDAALLRDARDEARTDQFYADPRLPPKERAELGDYKGSGFDRGHMAPAADQPTPSAMAQSFALSNMVPQDRINNQRIWAKVESDVRKYVRRAKGDVYVFSGPLFDASPETMGRQRVWIPTRLFKLVYDASEQRAWAYILDNRADTRVEAPVPYERFVQQTGWKVLADVPVNGTISGRRLDDLSR